MTVQKYLRTIDLARAGCISVQQVRNYEALGMLPPVERSKSGYRLYTQMHLAALNTTRSLITGYGWPRARTLMQAVHRGDLAAALAAIDEHHALLAGKRQQVEQTLAALRTLAAQPDPSLLQRHVHPRLTQPLRVGQAAKQVGVRVSALRFWEQQGLLHPTRDQFSRYRLYDEQQMRRLRVVVLLREAGYGFDVIHTTLEELAALSAFRAYISEFWAHLCASFQETPCT
ncbi:MAG: MerR family transcriptional regulator [Ktedonobacteraceae bacterium]|nr:MerR family transcriptional regulator [Ktedonobacteraceae bacterium]